ncbi:MAG: UDP-N-acetylmuramoyl-L-alanine--D-glutamate ligase [Chitinophagales bacterium]|nr:UDP-N-acetylmuramoyl-L-alanine--D-glutamate ligase [Chitinophagales bacterium]
MAKRFVILGAGESGIGTAILAQQKGFDVFVSDSKAIVPFYREQLIANGIAFEEGKHTTELILNADEVMKSPGIPEKVEIVKMIRAKGIQICSEIDFASRYTDAFLIGITGSNGKSTTTTLIHHLLVKGGLNAALVGNIGKSFALAVAQGGYDYYVIEVSNFQLDDIHTFRPNIAVLLNITPDHLDRYNYQMAGYVHSKFRITENQTAEDYFIYCADDPVLKEEMPKRSTKAQMIPFSIETEISNGAYLQNETLTFNINQKPNFTMSIYELSLQGKHNQHNSLAAGIAANIVNVRNEIIRESMRDFENLEHRMEPVLTIKGIDFINDSKATNVNSTWYALESINKPVIWIAGGLDKGNDYTVLQSLVKEKVKAIICLGKDNRKIHEAFARYVDMIGNTQSAHEAVMMAYHLGQSGDAVLMSPACASFDLFENYEDRGLQFKAAVRSL